MQRISFNLKSYGDSSDFLPFSSVWDNISVDGDGNEDLKCLAVQTLHCNINDAAFIVDHFFEEVDCVSRFPFFGFNGLDRPKLKAQAPIQGDARGDKGRRCRARDVESEGCSLCKEQVL